MRKISQQEVQQVSGGFVDGTPDITIMVPLPPWPVPNPTPVSPWIVAPIGNQP